MKRYLYIGPPTAVTLSLGDEQIDVTLNPAAGFVELPESHDYVRGLVARGLLIELPNDTTPAPRGKVANAANAATEQSSTTGAK